ncbi:MAG: hypothetical protein K2X43_16135 [Hyphomonadaceae bacterium]|nr:hypothetical protein [Hyphomonadaceae bacterium]
MDHPLAHLSGDQLDELVARYYTTRESVAALMRAFGIEGRPSSFVSMLPPVVHKDLCCAFCEGQNLVSQRLSRDRSSTISDPSCPSCGHRADPRCTCAHCQALAARRRAEIDRRKREVIGRVFAVPKEVERNPADLSLRDAVYLLALFRHSVSEDLSFAEPYAQRRDRLAPSSEDTRRVAKHLWSKRLIVVGPDSDTDAFIFNDDLTDCPQLYLDKVVWAFLPGQPTHEKREFLSELERLARDGPWPEGWSDQFNVLWHEIAKAECLQYYTHSLAERGYELETLGEKTHAVFDELLLHFSIGQVFNLSWQAVRDTTDYIVKERLPKYHAKNSFIGAVQRKADKARAEGWTIRNSRRDFNCPQTVVSSVFFDVFAQVGGNALEMIPPASTASAA